MIYFVPGTLLKLKSEMRKVKSVVSDLRGLQSSWDEETHGEIKTVVEAFHNDGACV